MVLRLQELLYELESDELFQPTLQSMATMDCEALNIEITNLQYDSRKCEPGAMFVAVKGFHVDGHQFAQKAVERGAQALVVERSVVTEPAVPQIVVSNSRKALASLAAAFCHHPSRKLRMVGVTGTNGKTTITCLIEALYRKRNQRMGVIGTIGNRLGERKWPAKHTTPEALDLQLLLAEMADAGAQAVVMEVSSHALALDRVLGVDYAIAIFTNLTQDHLDLHGTMENYRDAKAKLFRELGQGDEGRGKAAVINGDDPEADYFVSASTAPVWTYGCSDKCRVYARDVQIKPGGVSFQVHHEGGSFPISLKLTGMFNVYNSLAAITVGLVEGMAPADIQAALASVAVPGRFETVDCGQPFAVIVDYAHTPDGLENVLVAARKITNNRVITLFGCGGDRDRTKRPKMGAVVARLSDQAIVTSDNPRSEDPLKIIEDILPGVKGDGQFPYQIIPDRRAAILAACREAQPGDVVMIAGKGHEDYQILGAKTIHFDDREEARNALAMLGFRAGGKA